MKSTVEIQVQTSPEVKGAAEVQVQTSPAVKTAYDVSIKECLQQPQDAPLNDAEQKLSTHFVKRQLNLSSDKVTVQCKTGGQPLILKKITRPRKASLNASASTKRERTRQLKRLRNEIAGQDKSSQHIQLSGEIKSLPQSTKEQVCAEAGVQSSARFDCREGLHIKNNTGLTWCQLRRLKKLLAARGVKFQCEKKRT